MSSPFSVRADLFRVAHRFSAGGSVRIEPTEGGAVMIGATDAAAFVVLDATAKAVTRPIAITAPRDFMQAVSKAVREHGHPPRLRIADGKLECERIGYSVVDAVNEVQPDNWRQWIWKHAHARTEPKPMHFNRDVMEDVNEAAHQLARASGLPHFEAECAGYVVRGGVEGSAMITFDTFKDAFVLVSEVQPEHDPAHWAWAPPRWLQTVAIAAVA